MSLRIGKMAKKKIGIGSQTKWRLIAADAEQLQLISFDEPAIKWAGSYDQFRVEFEPLDLPGNGRNPEHVENRMDVLARTVSFDNEGKLQEALQANGLGGQTYHDDLLKMLDAGTAITVLVPGMPRRAIVRRSSVEQVTDLQIGGTELMAIPLPGEIGAAYP